MTREERRERDRISRRAYRLTHLEEVRAQDRARRRAYYDPEKERLRRIVRRDVTRELNRKWWERNPERHALYVTRRRARQAAAGGSHTIAEWVSKCAAFGGRCAYCGRGDVKMTRDHVVPLSRGGRDDIANIVPACRSCNSRKNVRTLPMVVAA